MLKFWTSHKEYIDFLLNASSALNASDRKSLDSYSNSLLPLGSYYDLINRL